MDNSKVIFRRGGSELPRVKTDGQILLDVETGRMYSDFLRDQQNEPYRIAINGALFGVAEYSGYGGRYFVSIPGVPRYFNGLTVTVVFENTYDRSDYLDIAIVDTNLGTSLDYTRVINSIGEFIMCSDISTFAVYQFVWVNGTFRSLSGSGGSPQPPGPEPTTREYLTFTANEAGSTIGLDVITSGEDITPASLEYSIDGGTTWNNYNWNDYTGETITLASVGDTVKFRGINSTFCDLTSYYHKFVMSGSISASGDITSILNGAGGDVRLVEQSTFAILFCGCTSLTQAPSLPSTYLSHSCYESMFTGCTSLVNAPELPATNLSVRCYARMFAGCISLVNAPELPATILNDSCYESMFAGCTSLVNTPELPAITTSYYCYFGMFAGCTSLVNTPELPATYLSDHCYEIMFKGCTSLANAPVLPATSVGESSYNSMFKDCTSLISAPELPATSVGESSYNSMFKDCTSLVNPPSRLPADRADDSVYANMFYGCTSLTTAPDIQATSLNNRCCEGMFAGCTSLKTAPEMRNTTHASGYSCSEMFRGCTSLTTAPSILPATNLGERCYFSMFYGCEALETVPELPATNLLKGCYESMFYGCTSLTESPVLPAEQLTDYCYSEMFYGCNSLERITCLSTSDLSVYNNSTGRWVEGVSSSGTFYKNPNTPITYWDTVPNNGIPTGWTVEDYAA